MTVIDVHRDTEALSMTITAEFDATPAVVWQLWANPRKLEQWWGPPTYPATFVEHELTPGSMVTYFMTGPDGDQPRGWWRIASVEEPNRLSFEDGFADAEGSPVVEMPTMKISVAIDEISADRTRMSVATTFASIESMEQMIAMGMEEGLTEAMGQIDSILMS